jgi:hypothetical protein
MNAQETLDAIAALIADHERGASFFRIDVDPVVASIRPLLDRHAAAQEEKKASRTAWAAEVRAAAATIDSTHGAELGYHLKLLLNTAASFVEHGNDLGGGMMAHRIKRLAQATVDYAHAESLRVRAAANAADALNAAGAELFNTVGATRSRPTWKAEEALRATFGLVDPDAAPATPDPKKKEN